MRILWCMVLSTVTYSTIADDESCRTACYKDKIPMCGAWAEFGSAWQPITCSSLNSAVSCRVNKVGEHKVTSNCLLKADTLTLSGRYRCQAFEKENNNDLVISSEAAINVVGIERFQVVHSSLRYGRPGHIEVEVCANPKPEIVWLTRGAVLQPGHSTHRLSALQLMQLKARDARRPKGPALPVPYCYRTHLVIGRVEEDDKYVSVIVRNEGETRYTPLKLYVLDAPSRAVYRTSLANSLLWFIISVSSLTYLLF
ncbi:unnamed protein product [Toxocara canis]|uniref:Ig-like domain-containing protein n=1 Tax=Toxocara canis TaxID=6265 RepID=A0A183UY05_TOXCA|nr:unnamed protein product [Toxocara canis]